MKQKIFNYALMLVFALIYVAVASFISYSIKNQANEEYTFGTCQTWINKSQSCVNAGGADFLCIDHHDPKNNKNVE